ncbi:MAG: acyl-CoA synthetase FdrA [bacterium]
MAVTKVEIRRGTYYDSLVLMELQVSLIARPGIINAGVMMGLAANKDLLKKNGLLTKEAEAALPDDLIISIEGDDDAAVEAALADVDNLLCRRRTIGEQEYRPKSIEAAAKMLPAAAWVLISVPGRYAADVAHEALRLKKNVFLYSDNVTLEDEILLKKEASNQGLLLMGPDCGTAIVNGIGFGFANRVRRGPIGLVGASGTGLQQVTARIHQLGSGITHALGTGGRDLSKEVGGVTARQVLDLLQRDPDTRVIVLISKPPAPEVASVLLRNARLTGKPVVVNFIGYSSPVGSEKGDNLHFTPSLDEAAELAVRLATSTAVSTPREQSQVSSLAQGQLYLRGLFSGGTLAHESLLILQNYLPVIYSNIALKTEHKLADSWVSQGHTIIDLGEDEFTVGRPHPMLDNSLRLERFRQEADDSTVAIILMDVVLGYGAHPDPASELAPAISEARARAKAAGRELEIVVVVVGTDEDPQDLASQIERLQAAGARVETSTRAAGTYVGQRLQAIGEPKQLPAVDLAVLQQSVEVINVGLESFAASISAQKASVIHVDWRPPAGGNDKLISILKRMKKK